MPPPPAAERRPAGRPCSSWPSATLKRPPARRGPGRPQPPTAPRAPCAEPPASLRPRSGPGPGPTGPAAARPPPILAPDAALLLQRRQLEKPLPARPRRPCAPPAPCPRVAALPRRPLPRSPRLPGPPAALRPALQVSLLNERRRYDDVEYEEEAAPALDEGLVRRCTEWLRGVEAAARGRARRLDSRPHLGTL